MRRTICAPVMRLAVHRLAVGAQVAARRVHGRLDVETGRRRAVNHLAVGQQRQPGQGLAVQPGGHAQGCAGRQQAFAGVVERRLDLGRIDAETRRQGGQGIAGLGEVGESLSGGVERAEQDGDLPGHGGCQSREGGTLPR